MLTKLRRVKQWEIFARSWWVYDAKWQDPWDSGQLIARYLLGKHKPIWYPDTDCGDHVVVINAGQVALPNEEWKWRFFFHNTQFAKGVCWEPAWAMHIKDPTFVLERAIYRFCKVPKQAKHIHNLELMLPRKRAFARLTLRNDDVIPEHIKEKITGQIRQLRPVPRRLNDIANEELDNFPKLFDYERPMY